MSDQKTRDIPSAGGAMPAVVLPPHLKKPRLRRFEVPQYLELKFGLTIAAATLAKLASTGGGPAFQKSNRTPLYPVTELDRWATSRLGKLVVSTSERGQ